MRASYTQHPNGIAATVRVRVPGTGQVIESTGLVPYTELGGVSGLEVGRFGSRLVSAAKKIARSKAVRGVARAAMSIARATPYGAAADAALGVARQALGRGRGRGSRPGPRPRPGGSTGPRGGAPARLELGDRQRVQLARRLLRSGLRGRALVRALQAVLS